ncbi:metallopeptidase, putative [Bodo saltans]|uniref:COP9 signalosome complex subunit 5 n=1 Tax=Bodo saltans TaxID=75058 RepID=A0A0S4KHQ1_BODSA|nr:metallopeptidase, putative [Bodo saltans]|eukprot:CUI15207.1 metallopeptidase, putative [Bodo saltans]
MSRPTSSASTTKHNSGAATSAQWEASNRVITSDVHWEVNKAFMDSAYAQRPRPWAADPRYFTSIRMSALAALKILIHAKTGQGKKGTISHDKNNWVEVMGLVQGHFFENTLVVTDAFALPVDASEVECSMNDRSISYMLAQLEYSSQQGKPDAGCVGWYHSHPGYSCFLSGIDVNTQRVNQSVQDPWVAIVVDPVQTAATGKIEIRAFRTLPERAAGGGPQLSAAATGAAAGGAGGSTTAPSQLTSLDASSIPAEKIAEFGVYVNEYYELPITLVRSHNDARQLDLLWSKYWMNCLAAASPLIANRPFVTQSLRGVVQKQQQATPEDHRVTAQMSGSNLQQQGAKGIVGRGAASTSITQAPTTEQMIQMGKLKGSLHHTPAWQIASQRVVSDVQQSLLLEESKRRLFGR